MKESKRHLDKYLLKESTQLTGHAKTIINIGCSKPQHSSKAFGKHFFAKTMQKNWFLKTSESAFLRYKVILGMLIILLTDQQRGEKRTL
jgi:hypothetical protein